MPERIVLVSPTRLDKQPYPRGCCFQYQWTEWQREAQSFEAMAGYHWGLNFLVLPDGSEFVSGLLVTPDYFRVLGIHPGVGAHFRNFRSVRQAGLGYHHFARALETAI